jgi:hypothetical protein
MTDRQVRFLPNFFDDIDAQLPQDRSAEGVPSAADFLVFDLPPLRDVLAAHFEQTTTELVGTPLRLMVAAGTLVQRIALYCYIDQADFVVVAGVDIDVEGPEGADSQM